MTYEEGGNGHSWSWTLGLVAVAAIALWPVVGDADCRAMSPDYTVALLELYTSEGCDSCPPADHWFSGLDFGPARRARPRWRSMSTTGIASAGGIALVARRLRNGNTRKCSVTAPISSIRRKCCCRALILLRGAILASPRALAIINARPPKATIELVAARTERATVAVDVHVRIRRRIGPPHRLPWRWSRAAWPAT